MPTSTTSQISGLSRVTPVSTFGRLAVLGLAAMLPAPPVSTSADVALDVVRSEVACLITDYRKGGCDGPPAG